jgi:ParB/RepB/Spo0J family partition protein
MAIKQIPLDEIVDNPFQPRKEFDRDALRSLADEMKAEGFWSGSLQGRRTKSGKVQLVFGHRRLRALRLLKAETVPVEIVDLTDAQMALRSLEENLQREGLTDLEKADAVKKAVEIEEAELRAAEKNVSHAIPQVAKRLGLGERWVRTLCEISGSLEPKNRGPVEEGHLSAKAAFLAKEWGGDDYVKALARQAKEAGKDESLPKPNEHTVYGMKKVVREAPEAVQEKLQELIWDGDITTPKEAEQKARRLAAERTKRNKRPPEDLETFLVGWTHRFKDWTTELEQLVPYLEYLDELPAAILTPFFSSRDRFLSATDPLRYTKSASPHPIGRGQTSAAASRRKRLA